jgi:hypothetical protein
MSIGALGKVLTVVSCERATEMVGVAVTLGKQGHNVRTGRHRFVIAPECQSAPWYKLYDELRGLGRVIAKCRALFPRNASGPVAVCIL